MNKGFIDVYYNIGYFRALAASFAEDGKPPRGGYCANTVGEFSNSEVIKQYIKNRGKDSEYKKLHQGQLSLEL